jgi:tRNA threonylcarbamoyladenosine dehydratase
MHWLERTELLVGPEKLEKLKNAGVLVVGLGGVGAIAAEMICRAGVGKMTIVDSDVVEVSNRNRQLPALVSTTGKLKTDILKQRLQDINPDLRLVVINSYITVENALELLKSQPYDYVVDAIDTLSPKTALISLSVQAGLKVVSAMGAGGKMDPTQVTVADISKSYNCKLARMLRKRLSKMNITKGVQVIFSAEKVNEKAIRLEDSKNKKSTVGTISYMPALFGCMLAGVVINGILES